MFIKIVFYIYLYFSTAHIYFTINSNFPLVLVYSIGIDIYIKSLLLLGFDLPTQAPCVTVKFDALNRTATVTLLLRELTLWSSGRVDGSNSGGPGFYSFSLFVCALIMI